MSCPGRRLKPAQNRDAASVAGSRATSMANASVDALPKAKSAVRCLMGGWTSAIAQSLCSAIAWTASGPAEERALRGFNGSGRGPLRLAVGPPT
jgi:hypothetical protein